MRIGLFAAREVGQKVAELFAGRGSPPCLLVVDAQEPPAARERIEACSGVPAEHRFRSDALAQESVLEQIRSHQPDLLVLAWWPYIIKEPLLSLPRLGFLNFHPSLLPHARGKHPNFWSIVERCPFGVTLHWIDAGVDSGAIAFQRRIEVDWEDTGETLYGKAQRNIVDLFEENFEEIVRGEIPRVPQEPGAGSFHRAREIDGASMIELGREYTGRQLLDLIRARTFPPHPAAWFVDDAGRKYEVRISITQRVEE